MQIISVIDHASFGDSWPEIVRLSAEFADMLWFRIKNLPDDELMKECERFRKLTDVPALLSARADIADKLGFYGVQLGASTESPESVKAKYPKLVTGYSAHSMDEIKKVEADRYTLSPLFMTKKDYEVRPLGVPDVSGLDKKIFGLGGISLSNVGQLRGKGYAGIAGIGFYKELEAIKAAVSSF